MERQPEGERHLFCVSSGRQASCYRETVAEDMHTVCHHLDRKFSLPFSPTYFLVLIYRKDLENYLLSCFALS